MAGSIDGEWDLRLASHPDNPSVGRLTIDLAAREGTLTYHNQTTPLTNLAPVAGVPGRLRASYAVGRFAGTLEAMHQATDDTLRVRFMGTQPADCIGRRMVAPEATIGHGFLFVLFEQLPEVGDGASLVRKVDMRKVAVLPRSFESLFQTRLGPLAPANPGYAMPAFDHVLNTNPAMSPFLSASNRPFGAMSIGGTPILIDSTRVGLAGGRIMSVNEVAAELYAYMARNPGSAERIKKLIWAMRQEGEVLIHGTVPAGAARPVTGLAHLGHIREAEALWAEFQALGRLKGPELERAQAELAKDLAKLETAYNRARMVGRVGRVLTVVGVVFTVKDVAAAGKRSYDQGSMAPLGAETIRQVGGWGSAIAGAKIGGVVGAAFGIETGPGAILTGAAGALVFGIAGYFGADWVADQISPNPE